MKARKSVESLEQNVAETIAQSVDKNDSCLPDRVKSVFIIQTYRIVYTTEFG